VHRTSNERVLRPLNSGLVYGPACVTLDRLMRFTASFRETKKELVVLRWAKALKQLLRTHFRSRLAELSEKTISNGGNLQTGKPPLGSPPNTRKLESRVFQ
jgi:hypothetical protein